MKGAVTILRLGSLEGGDDGGTLVSPHVIRDQVPCAAWPWLPRGKAPTLIGAVPARPLPEYRCFLPGRSSPCRHRTA